MVGGGVVWGREGGCRSDFSIDLNSVILDWRSLFKPVYSTKQIHMYEPNFNSQTRLPCQSWLVPQSMWWWGGVG